MRFPSQMAEELIRNDAIMFDPDKGWLLNTHRRYPDAPRSPFYIDLRAPLRSRPRFRRKAARYIEQLIEESGIFFHCISDAPQAVTPLVVALSDMTDVPMISPRLAAKGHGLGNEIDGFYEVGQSVIVIDDLRTSGRTLEEIIALYRRNGLMVSACLTLIDRAANEDNPRIGDVPYITGFRWSELLYFCRDRQVVTHELYDRCIRYPAELRAYVDAHEPIHAASSV